MNVLSKEKFNINDANLLARIMDGPAKILYPAGYNINSKGTITNPERARKKILADLKRKVKRGKIY